MPDPESRPDTDPGPSAPVDGGPGGDGDAERSRLGIGGLAPPIALPGTDGTEAGRRLYTLEELRGHPVVLAFYPADHSPVCTAQLTTYTADIGRFADVDAHVLAISPQTIAEHDAFAQANGGFAFPLLVDVDRTAAVAYDVLGPLGFYRRSIFVIDADGVLRWAHRAAAGFTFRSVDEIVAAVAAL